jgi:hypothetical protein
MDVIWYFESKVKFSVRVELKIVSVRFKIKSYNFLKYISKLRLKMKTADSSERLVATYQVTRRHIPEDRNVYFNVCTVSSLYRVLNNLNPVRTSMKYLSEIKPSLCD